MNASRTPRSFTAHGLALAFFAAATVLLTWPQAARLHDRTADLFDGKYCAWALQWDFRQTLRHPLELFQAPIFHPARYALAFSENLYGVAVFGFPLLAAGAGAYLNYNVLFLLAMFLSAFCCWKLAFYVTRDAAASLAAGLIFAFLPYKMSQVSHLHMEWGGFFCLVCLYLLRYLDEGRPRDAVLLAVFFAWNGIACVQYGIFGTLLAAIVLAFEAVSGGPGRGRRLFGAILAIGVGTLLWLPFLIPYGQASRLYDMRRYLSEMTFFSARPGYFLSAGERNKLYGELTRRWRGPEGDFFPGFVPLFLAGVAVWKLRCARADRGAQPPEVSRRRRRLASVLDGVSILFAGVFLLASFQPGLRLGSLRIGDPGRVLVLLTAAVAVRLLLAFPKGSAFRDLGDRLRRSRVDRRVLLLVAVAAGGVLIALGGHTPYYRFLFQSFGPLFRAVRAVARGIVLFQLALAVLAAWGLSVLGLVFAGSRGRSAAARGGMIAAILVLIGIEYRAFPLKLDAFDATRQPIDAWLAAAPFTGGLVEWPLGFPHDCDYTFRQGAHQKPLVNGYSGFAPREYSELVALTLAHPTPDAFWDAMRNRDAQIVVYHPHETRPAQVLPYRRLVGEAIAKGRLELLGSAAHGAARDFVFRLSGSSDFASGFSAAEREEAAAALQAHLNEPVGRISPPFGVIHAPAEGQTVEAGSWGFGWALDDSGIAEIRIGTELGPGGMARLGGKWPGLAETYPDVLDSANGGYGFAIPNVPAGAHVLEVTLVARDGGTTTLSRPIVVAPPSALRR